MSSSRRKKTTRRTKDQLLQELEVTQRLLIEKEEELVICQEELARYIQEQPLSSTAHQDVATLRKQLKDLETRLDRTTAKLAEREEMITNHASTLARKEAKIEKLQREVKKLKQKKPLNQPVTHVPAVVEAPLPNGPSTQAEKLEELPARTPPHSPTPTKPQRYTVPIQIAPFTQLVKENQPFEATVNIDLGAMSEKKPLGLHCSTRLFAKRLSDGWSLQIGEAASVLEAGTRAITIIKSIPLPAGDYHLQAVAAFTTASGTPLPIASLHEGELLQVI